MLSRFGIPESTAATYVIAFVIILVLVALFGVVLRRLTGGRLMLPGQDRGRARQPRLGIVDIYDLDRQRQLILLRRDNVEHLLLIGGPNDVVIETNIVRVPGARLPSPGTDVAAERTEPTLDRPAEPQAPPRPQVEPAGRPQVETQLAVRVGTVLPRPGEGSDAEQELSPVGTVSAPAPARVEPPLKPDAVSAATPAASPRPLRAEPPAPRPSPLRPVEPASRIDPAPRVEPRPAPAG
ncbi:MAG TPA: hypothetical protein VFS03_00300, partial [Microvirga sp.]|nr:hypothetical protein [Microvirga sp.]